MKELLNQNLDCQLLSKCIENASEGILLVGMEGKIVYANKTLLENLNYSQEELIGMKIFKIDPNFLPKDWDQHWEKVKNKGELVKESKHIKKDGTIMPVELVINHFTYNKNKYHLTFVRDITRRKGVETKIENAYKEYKELIDGMNDTVWVINFESDILEVNKAAIDRLGYTREEFLQMSPADIDGSFSYEKIREMVKNMKHDEKQLFETTHITKKGEEIPVEVSSSLVNYRGKKAILSVARDITDRKEAEKEKEEMRQQMLQTQKMESIGRLAGGVAHDFNNILTVIQGRAQMGLMKIDKSNPIFASLQQIRSSSKKASKLTRQLLLFSREQETEIRPLNLNTVIRNLKKMLDRLIGEDIEINTDLENNLYNIKADESQMEQVITNLVVNARDAMEEGGKLYLQTKNIDINNINTEGLSKGQYVRLKVEDTGKGIEESIQDKIFEPFFTTKEIGEGTGMGLSVVHGIVQKHDGKIVVDSKPGEGTIFRVYLPKTEQEESDNHIEKRDLTQYKGHQEGILVVEDDLDVLKSTVQNLQEYNYKTYKAYSAQDAKKIFYNRKDSIQILLSDVVLPNQRGDELAKELKHEKEDIEVVLSSGYTKEKVSPSEIKQKGFEFISKPYKIEEILEKVHKLLN